jgi:hypothetical protein
VVAVSTVVVVSMGEVSVAVVSTAAVSAVAVSTAVVSVVAVLVGAITDFPMMSSSAALAFRGGGAGVIRMDITITVTTITHTITMAMDTAGTHTATTMDTADTVTTVAGVTESAMAADQGISEVRAELLRRIGLADVLTPRNLTVEIARRGLAVACGRRIKTGEPNE